MSTVDLPNIREPFIDQRTGQISRAWWIWLQQLMTRIGGSSGSDLAAIRQSIIELLASTREHDNLINGQVPVPVSLDGLTVFDESQVGAIPGPYASTLDTLAQFAATTSAQLAGVLSDETGTGSAVFGTSPTVTTPNIVGTATNDNAAAGSVGEFISSNQAPPGIALTTATPANITSISLTAGDWDAWATVGYAPAVTTTVQAFTGTISTVSATHPTTPNGGAFVLLPYAGPAGNPIVSPVGTMRLSLASTTTVYLVSTANFSVSTLTGYGFIGARRVR